jgi:hypothetical protein
MIDFLEKYLFQLQIILAIVCWIYIIKYLIHFANSKK